MLSPHLEMQPIHLNPIHTRCYIRLWGVIGTARCSKPHLVIHPIQSNHPRCSIHPSCHLEPVSNGTGNYGHYYGQRVARRMKEQAWSNHAKMIDCIFLYLLNLLLCRQPRGAIIVAARSTDCLISSASGSLTSKRSNGRKICIQLQAVNVLLMNKLGRRLASFGIKRWWMANQTDRNRSFAWLPLGKRREHCLVVGD